MVLPYNLKCEGQEFSDRYRGMAESPTALQLLDQLSGHIPSAKPRPLPLPAAPSPGTAQVSTLQAQTPVITRTVPVHQLVCQLLSSLLCQATLVELVLALGKNLDLCGIHRKAVRPAPTINV